MIVTCPKCSTSYDFDETLVGSKGTVVRCTQCSHLFKIFSDESDDSIQQAGWMVRKRSGKVFGIDKFGTIQKWIREGKIDDNDELSRTGKSWKRLGEIVELQTLFASLRASGALPPKAKEAPAQEDAPRLSVHYDQISIQPPLPAAETRSSTPPTGQVPEPFTVSARKADAQRTGAVRDVSYEAPGNEEGTIQGPLPRSLSSAQDAAGEAEASDDLLMPSRPGSWKRWVLAISLVAVAGLGVLGWFERTTIRSWVTGLSRPAEQDDREKALDRAHEYFLLDTTSYMDQAEQIFRDLLEQDERDVRAAAGLAEVLTTRAQYARDQRDLFGRGGGASVEDVGTLAREAKKLSQVAVLASPGDLAALRALADAFRLSEDLDGARKYVDKALDVAPRDPEALYVAALIDWDDGVPLDKVLGDLERIVKRPDATIRIRYRLALLYAVAGRKGDSRKIAKEILDLNSDHLLASKLIEVLDSGTFGAPPKPEAKAEDDATSADAAEGAPDAPSEAEVEADVPAEEAKAGPPSVAGGGGAVPKAGGGGGAATDGSGVPEGKTYDFYVSKGMSYQSSGSCDKALGYFQKALQANPSSMDALSGSGYCYMSLHDFGSAISSFQKALKTNKNFGPAIIGLAQAQEKKGNIKGATESYQRYMDVLPNGPYASLAKKKLDELKDTVGPGDETTTPPPPEPGTGGAGGTGDGGAGSTPSPEVEKKVEVEVKGSVGQPTSDTPKTEGDPY